MTIDGKKNRSYYKHYNIIKRTVLTEKRTNQLDQFATYIFEVEPGSNKRTIKYSVNKIFGVEVIKVNVLNTPEGKKIAMVKLKENEVILLEKINND